eukprot:3493224-Pyramimonas_sp.AAC.1
MFNICDFSAVTALTTVQKGPQDRPTSAQEAPKKSSKQPQKSSETDQNARYLLQNSPLSRPPRHSQDGPREHKVSE